MAESQQDFRVAGASPPRLESVAKVTGQARYTDDIALPGMAYGRIIRSPYAHAKVTRIDKTAAEKVPGVIGILLPADVADKRFNCSGNPPSAIMLKDERVLTDHPLCAGDRVAAIVAVSPEACEEAARKMVIEYQALPAVFDIREAIRAEADPLHPEFVSSNILKKMEVVQGDVAVGFEGADYIFEEEFHTPAQAHMAMEPTGCICDYSPDGRLTVWSTTQTPFQERRVLADLLDMPESKVRIIKPPMGGGFGARQQTHNQPVGAFLARLARRPVKIINSREEELYATTTRHEALCRIKVGVAKDGRLQAVHIKVYINTGAYCTHGPIVVAAMSKKFQYNVINYHFEGYCVYSNATTAGAMRGYGNPQVIFGREVMLDRIAEKLGIDPLEYRVSNHVRVGDTVAGMEFPLDSCAIDDCVAGADKIKRAIDDEEERGRQAGADDATTVTGWGVAFSCHCSGPSNNDGLSSCLIHAHDDGSVNLYIGAADIGQGSDTTLSQIAAEELGISLQDLNLTAADTLCTPYDNGTFASSQIYVSGNAVKEAATDLVGKIKDALAVQHNLPAADIAYRQGVFTLPNAPEATGRHKGLTFKEALAAVMANKKNRVFIGSSSFKARRSPLPFAVCWAKVAVDKRTGAVRVLHVIQAVDVGTAINPDIVKTQVEGGIMMGLGYAMMEGMENDRRAAKPASADMLHYKVPTFADMPGLHVYIADSFEPTGPFGAKSVGELPIVAVAPAIANAVRNATGTEITRLPLPCLTPTMQVDTAAIDERRSGYGKGE